MKIRTINNYTNQTFYTPSFKGAYDPAYKIAKAPFQPSFKSTKDAKKPDYIISSSDKNDIDTFIRIASNNKKSKNEENPLIVLANRLFSIANSFTTQEHKDEVEKVDTAIRLLYNGPGY